METYRFIDYNELATKPDNNDVVAIYDIDADELKKFKYNTLKSLFVKTDEDTDIAANHEYQANKKLLFGSDGEFEIMNNSTDTYMKGTTAAGKLIFQLNSTDFMQLSPTDNSIRIGDRYFNYDGAAGQGIQFDGSNKPHLKSVLECDAGISLNLKNISYNGNVNTGLKFDTGNNAFLYQNLIVDGNFQVNGTVTHNQLICTGTAKFNNVTEAIEVNGPFDMNGNIAMSGNYIGYTGTAAGLYFDADNTANFTGYVRGILGVKSSGIMDTPYFYLVASVTEPSTVSGRVVFFGAGSNTVKMLFPDGTLKAIATTPG